MTDTSKSPNSTMILLGSLFIFASFVVLMMFQLPALKEARVDLDSTQATANAKQDEVQRLTAAQTTLATKEQELRSSGVNPDTLSSIIPPTENVPSLYIQMEAQLKNAPGLSKTSYQIGKPAIDPVDGIAKIPLTITTTAGYSNLKILMHNLETNIRPVTFSSINLSLTGDSTGPAPMTLSGTGFFRSQTVSSAYSGVAQ